MTLLRITFIGLLTLAASACASQSRVSEQSPASSASYHTFMAEVALQRRKFKVAAKEYAQAAQLSSDPEIAQRATQVAFTVEQPELALDSAQRWLDLDDTSIEARRFLANLSVKKGDLEPALEYLQQAIALSGESEADNAFLPLTTLLMREQDREAATSAMAELAKKHDENAKAHFSVALLALQSGDVEMALASAEKARALAPDWSRAEIIYARALIANGQVDEGLAIAKAVAQTSGDVAIGLEYGGLLVDSGHNDEAREQLGWVLEKDKDSPGALFALGLLEMREDNLDAAEEHLTRLLASGRRTLDAMYYLGAIAETKKDFRTALQLYARVQTGDYATSAQVRVARMLHKLDKSDAAIAHLKRRREAFPDEDVAMSEAQAQILIDNDEMEAALSVYDFALERNPENRSLMFARSFLFERMGRVDDALRVLRDLHKQDPDDPIALNALGYTLADRTERYQEALRYISRALELEPDDAAIVDSMGWVHYRLGNYDKAKAFLTRANQLTPDPEIAAHLGEVLWVYGETEEAKAVWEKALVDNPDHTKLIDTVRRFMP